jgi:hypothetical protein
MCFVRKIGSRDVGCPAPPRPKRPAFEAASPVLWAGRASLPRIVQRLVWRGSGVDHGSDSAAHGQSKKGAGEDTHGQDETIAHRNTVAGLGDGERAVLARLAATPTDLLAHSPDDVRVVLALVVA